MIFQATIQTRSKQLGANLSKDLQKKYGKKSARVVEGDSVTILRGEFKGVDGKVAKISTQKSSVAIDGVKKEKTKGDKFAPNCLLLVCIVAWKIIRLRIFVGFTILYHR